MLKSEYKYKRIVVTYVESEEPTLEADLQALADAKTRGKVAPFILSELKKIAKRRKVKP